MLVFPQIATGGSALYPLVKRQAWRTVVNRLDGGERDIHEDALEGEATAWELHARDMTRAESDAIDALFQQTAGAWGTFTFLDPAGNLLEQSETLTDAIWNKDALIGLTPGVTDPMGMTRATRVTNGAGIAGHITQTLNAPGNFQYCLSAWIRSGSGASVSLSITSGSGSVAQSFAGTAQWQRVFVAGNPGQASATTVTVSMALAAGASADVFGLQMETQLAPSDYKSTVARSGVFPNARFATDQLEITARGTDQYDAVIRIVSRGN